MEISERLSAVVAASGLTKTAFAAKINVGQSHVSQLCSGAKVPSDRTIADICREFNVDETWLRTGEGEMFRQKGREEELAAFMGQLLNDRPDSFRSRLLTVLLRFDPEGPEWKILENIFEAIKKEAQD